MHPRNRHQGRYHFEALKKKYPELNHFVAKNKYGDESIDFSNPEAVKTLNRALLKDFYNISVWDIPKNYLCPPIPGRGDYIHHLADLLLEERGSHIHILDIGVGANCIYPIIGHCEYGWNFVGADINPVSIESAKHIADSNEALKGAINFKLQKNEKNIFKGIIEPGEFYHATLCNPPFHGSLEEAQAGTRRKQKSLAKNSGSSSNKVHEKQVANFGGQGAELWCAGGELAFIQTMIQESALFKTQCHWFSSLVSKEQTLPKIESALRSAMVKEFKVLEMAQGQKKSRIVAWRF